MTSIEPSTKIITTTTTPITTTNKDNVTNSITTVDITTIEQQKENIIPLSSGRSASHLTSLTLTSRSTLELKLLNQHLKFQSQLNAISIFESTGTYEEGLNGFTTSEVITLADDPLDVHHLYIRFVMEFYPAGASATSRLVPLLEESTRKFLGDERYKNDPRYLRLWTTYARHMNCAEDCFRFLFAKGVGERLASLYEEYARVLEVSGKRQQADQVYSLGIDRLAQPLPRLKKSYLDFQTRMLLAPPLPSPSSSTSTTSPFTLTSTASSLSTSTSRSINGSTATVLGLSSSTSSTTTTSSNSIRENGAKEFSIFKDDNDNVLGEGTEGGNWEDLGTIKSRRRENDLEATEWKGETMIMGGRAILPVIARIEVFRDDDVPPPTPSNNSTSDHTDTLIKSIRGPSEADLLKQNPFKNYSAADLSLTSIEPSLESNSQKESKSSSSRSKSSSSSSKSKSSKSKSSSSDKSKSNSSTTTTTVEGEVPVKAKERVACDLKAVYPESGKEFSFEELKVLKFQDKYLVDPWSNWEWFNDWKEEVAKKGVDTYIIDSETSWPVLYDASGAPLWDFLPRPIVTAPSPSPSPIHQTISSTPSPPSAQQQHQILHSPSPSPRFTSPPKELNLLDLTPVSSPQKVEQVLISPLPVPTVETLVELEDSPPRFYPDPHRAPSPTMNTRQAEAMVNDLFAHTLRFGGGGDFDEEEEEEEPSTADESDSDEEEDDDEIQGGPNPFFVIPPSQLSQFEGEQSQLDHHFVPFSQTASQLELMGDGNSFSRLGNSQIQLEGLSEEDDEEEDDEEEEEEEERFRPQLQPMTLFRDPVVTSIPNNNNNNNSNSMDENPPVISRGGFKPIMKSTTAGGGGGSRTFGTPMASQRAFMVMQDEPEESEDRVIEEEEEDYEREGGEGEFEAPLRGNDSDEEYESRGGGNYRQGELGDGFGYGRRPQGANRFAPMIDNMTPITERTYEFSSVTRTTSTNLSTSQRSRRDSAHPITAIVMEEDEDEDEDEEGSEGSEAGFGDRAFVAYGQSSQNESSSSSSSSSDEDEEDELLPPPVTTSLLVDYEPVTSLNTTTNGEESIPEWRDSTRKDHQFDEEEEISREEGSYDVSVNGSLPEGFTINGNQSGMTTGLVLTDTSNSNFGQNDSILNSTSTTSTTNFDNPCNPYDTQTLDLVLSLATPSVLEHSLVRNLTDITANKLENLQKTAKKREAKAAKSKDGKTKDRTGVFDEVWELNLDQENFSVREKLGEGAFGAVFRIAIPMEGDSQDYDDDEEETSVAVKVERPTNLWEFHILQQLHSRLSPRIQTSVVSASKLYAFKDESYLFLDFSDQGTLLDAVNKADESGISPPTGGITLGLEEVVAMFFVIELLRVLEGFHEAGFIHGDLKIDNCLVRLEQVVGGAKAWSSTYDPSGGGGWSSKGIKIIDFGRSIDRNVYSPQQTFKSNLPTDEFDCIEMREGNSWTFEPDYFGAASIAFNLLFGRYIETKEVQSEAGERKFVIAQPFKRYHQEELWTKLFDALLNPKQVREDGQLPITNELRTIREEMESWLQKNSDRNGKNLRSLIKKMETYWLAKA